MDSIAYSCNNTSWCSHGDPWTDIVSPGPAQQSVQQPPGGGGVQHTQAGHMGVESANTQSINKFLMR